MKRTNQKSVRKLAAAAPTVAAVSRTMSFTQAAHELGVHQSAISHKINALEEDLGFALFTRTTRNVTPTLQGGPVCAACESATDALEHALDAVLRIQQRDGATLSLSSSLAMKWVVPAMTRAQASGLKLTLNVDDELTEFGPSSASNAAIRFGPGPYPGLYATVLSSCFAIPVSSGSLASSLMSGERRAVLLRDTRAEMDDPDNSWEQYLGAERYGEGPFDTSVTFERTDVAIQAAIGGMGHALARSLLFESDLEAGLLVNSGPPKSVASKYWLVTTYDFAQTDAFEKLSSWLAAEVRLSKQLFSKHRSERYSGSSL
ncbi:LysR family transcriptional regulator [uncultured Roseobacter sp.]|uniref:LysR family transcriptional regulator n=1 Tax=uncultured Roseobacter sp. TaxID=114847 RepID=UPI002638692A|nr:LysR family transcriptional regulator [uncultured Roseobacter sp.]